MELSAVTVRQEGSTRIAKWDDPACDRFAISNELLRLSPGLPERLPWTVENVGAIPDVLDADSVGAVIFRRTDMSEPHEGFVRDGD